VNSGDAVSVLDASWCEPGWGEGERIVRAVGYVAPRRRSEGGLKGWDAHWRLELGGAEKLPVRTLRTTRGRGVDGAVLPCSERMTRMECAAR
jgi:hypothetical protein